MLTRFSSFCPYPLFLFLQNAAEPVAAAETLAEVPEHVFRGLPEEVRLSPSAVDKTRIGETGVREGVGAGIAGCSQAAYAAFKVGS